MSRKFSIFLVLCIALFGAILAGYWDMLSSERQKHDGETVAQGETGSQTVPAPGTAEPKTPGSASPETTTTAGNIPADNAAAAPAVAAPPAPVASTPAETPPAETRTVAANEPAHASTIMSDAPRFDLLRVEPDGSAVIAGQAAADSEVRILSGDKLVGRAKASRDGDFALVLDERLTVGSHSIRIEAQGADGLPKASREIAVVNVPKPGNPGDLLAMIEQPGQPSRIIAAPKPDGAAPAAPTTATSDAEPQAGTTASREASVAPSTDASSAKPQSFAVEAVEIENGTIYIAGRAEGKDPVRVYIDDKLVGEDRSRANGRFLVTAQVPLTPGEHRIRADSLGTDGKVAARVEVPFTKPESETMSALAAAEPRTPAAASTPAPGVGTAPAPAMPSAPSPETSAQGTIAKDPSDIGTVVQPALQAVDTRVLIRRGDTLWRISRETYGFGRRYTVIYLANGDQIRNPNRIYPGQLLRLPKHEEAQTETR